MTAHSHRLASPDKLQSLCSRSENVNSPFYHKLEKNRFGSESGDRKHPNILCYVEDFGRLTSKKSKNTLTNLK